MRFSMNTTLWLTLSLALLCVGLAIMLGFIGQVALELPYHLSGVEVPATVIGLDSNGITVRYSLEDSPYQIFSSRVRGANRLPEEVQQRLAPGERIQVLYLPGNGDEVLPLAVSQKAGREMGVGFLGGLGIASPGIGLLLWLRKTRQIEPKQIFSLFRTAP